MAYVRSTLTQRTCISKIMILLAIIVTVLIHSSVTYAITVTPVPNSVYPGERYRLVFVTDGFTSGNSNQTHYNSFVESEAMASHSLAALNTSWTAIVSTGNISALLNTGTDPGISLGVPVYGLDGTLLASDNADLWDGYLSDPEGIHITPSGADLSSSSQSFVVWTGTSPDGTPNEVLGQFLPTWGRVNTAQYGSWVSGGRSSATSNGRIYGISDVIVVPEPSTLLLLAAGGIACLWRRTE